METGSATIWDQEKVTSTLAKLNRYSQFASGYAGKVHQGDTSTFYSRAFPDAWPPQLIAAKLPVPPAPDIAVIGRMWQTLRRASSESTRCVRRITEAV